MTSLDLVDLNAMPQSPLDWSLRTDWDNFTTGDFVVTTEITEEMSPEQQQQQPRPRQNPGSACEECRKRKSRCNRKQPTCGACASAGTECAYSKTCPPRGPKRGHLRVLRDKILALETRLSEQENSKVAQATIDPALQTTTTSSTPSIHSNSSIAMGVNDASSASSVIVSPGKDSHLANSNDASLVISGSGMTPFNDLPLWCTSTVSPVLPTFTQIDSHMLEALPHPANMPMYDVTLTEHQLTPLVRTDLDQLYFGRVNTFTPIMQKFLYLTWVNSPHKSRAKLCLQHTMWALAALFSTQFYSIRDGLYKGARLSLDLLETDYSEGGKKCIDQVQAWILLSLYEFMGDQHQRGLVSSGRALRLAQIMRLDDLDSGNHPVATSLLTTESSPLSPWTTIEAMRRTFWLAYCIDCFTAVHEGLSVSFGEQHIRTRLPAPNCKFINSKPFSMPFLSEVMDATVDGSLFTKDAAPGTDSPLVRMIIVATICSRMLCHQQQSSSEQNGSGPLDGFFARDAALSALLTPCLKDFTAVISNNWEHPDPTLLFAAMMTHMIVLRLYEITKGMPSRDSKMQALLTEHKERANASVRKLATIAEVLAQMNPFEIHPLGSIPLLVGARFCLANSFANDTYGSLFGAMKKALHAMANVSSLARDCLQTLGSTFVDNA